uniref:Transcription factor JunB n=1 Tax=Falco tinnunculus TaxID=100819 RepID=A0A8C4UJS3_FALTI
MAGLAVQLGAISGLQHCWQPWSSDRAEAATQHSREERFGCGSCILLAASRALLPVACTQSSTIALHLLPPAPAADLLLGSGVGSGEGGVGTQGDPEAPLGSAVELLLLKLPPATDLEQLLIQISLTGPFLYQQPVTQEQEGFANGFVKALADLQKQNQLLAALPLSLSGPCCPSHSGPANTDLHAVNTTLTSFNPAGPLTPPGLVFGVSGLENGPLLPTPGPTWPFEELQIVPDMQVATGSDDGSSIPVLLSLLDTESREQLKVEQKQLRNQITASKCQQWKLEHITHLEEKVKALKGQNAELATTTNLLHAQVMQLQGHVHSHLSSSCHINTTSPVVIIFQQEI